MDHYRANDLRLWYTYPTKVDDDVIEVFKDELPEIIAGKLKEILSLQDKLVDVRNKRLEKLQHLTKKEGQSEEGFEATKYMGALLAETDFREYYVLKKWLRYWLHLLEKSGNNISDIQEKTGNNFTEEEILRAKEYPIEDIYDGELRQVGSRFLGKCPFHKENTPSFTIFSNENVYHCFGCGGHGDSIDFYSKSHEVDFPKAVKALLK